MIIIILILALVIGFIYFLRFTLLRFKFDFNEKDMLMFFGLPGSGKTTVCADIIRQILTYKKLKTVIPFVNFPMKGAYKIDRDDIGSYDLSQPGKDKPLILLDEASTVYMKRDAMTRKKDGTLKFGEAENKFFSMHRHYHTEVVMFAQSWDGVDLRLRELSTGLFYVEPSRLPGWIKIRKISKIFTIDETHQPIDGYDFVRFSSRYVWARRCWKYFDTYDAP